MNARLLKEDEKSFTVEIGGKEIQVAKTPGTSAMLGVLKKTMGEKSVVPGKAKVKGDSPKNDTVVIRVSPGEGIIPREAMSSLESAKAFVEKMFANKDRQGGQKMNKGGKAGCYYDGGTAKTPAEEAAESMRKSFKFGKSFAEGGIVPEDDDDDEGTDMPIDINGTYSEGGVVKEEEDEEEDDDENAERSAPVAGAYNKGGKVKETSGYAEGGIIEDAVYRPRGNEEEIDRADMTQNLPAPVLTEPVNVAQALQPMAANPWNTPGPTNVNFVPPPAPANQVTTGTTNPNQEGTPISPTTAATPTGGPQIASLESSTSSFQTTSKEAKKAQDEALAQQQKANEQMFTIEEQKRNLTANALENRNLEIAQQNQAIKQKFAAQQAALNKMDEETRKVEQEALDARIKGDHLWGDEGTGNRILAAVGLALGGFGQGFNGKQNPAVDIINKALDRDIEIQKANAAQKGKAADLKRNQFLRMKEIYGDDIAAANAVKAMKIEQTMNTIQLIEARAASPEAKAKLGQMNAELAKEHADKKAQLDQFKTTKVTEEKPIKGTPLHAEQDATLGKNVNAVRQIDDLMAIKKAVNTGIISGNVQSALARLGMGDVKDAAALKQKSAALTAQIGRALFGNMSENERAYVESIVPGITTDDDIFMNNAELLRGDFVQRIKDDTNRWRQSGSYVPDVLSGLERPSEEAEKFGAKKKVK